MEKKIDWDRRDYWNEYDLYDGYFLSFHFDHAGVDEFWWKELIKKYGLNTRITTNMSGEDISAYNNNDYVLSPKRLSVSDLMSRSYEDLS
jgi:hypothetical protein